MISVVCPFYNEESVLETSVSELVRQLNGLDVEWELVIVNDGSTDGSKKVAEKLARRHKGLKLVSYDRNKGRGHALRRGMKVARGDPVFTTEIDGSWGDEIVKDMYHALSNHPEADMVIASPNIEGGGYKNVPMSRVLLSRYGNLLIRACMSFKTTMNTGMTRGYRRELLDQLPLYEDGKEFHLEVVLKASMLGKKVIEIPAVIEWRRRKQNGIEQPRRSSSNVKRLVGSHLFFSILASPVRYLWAGGLLFLLFALTSAAYSVYRYLGNEPYAFLVLGFLGFTIVSFLFFALGVLSEQNRLVLRELWRLQVAVSEDGADDETPPDKAVRVRQGE